VTIPLNKRPQYKKVYPSLQNLLNKPLQNHVATFKSLQVFKMKIFYYTDVEAKDAEGGSSKLKVRWLMGNSEA